MTTLADFGITKDAIEELAWNLWLTGGQCEEINWLRAELILLHKALHIAMEGL